MPRHRQSPNRGRSGIAAGPGVDARVRSLDGVGCGQGRSWRSGNLTRIQKPSDRFAVSSAIESVPALALFKAPDCLPVVIPGRRLCQLVGVRGPPVVKPRPCSGAAAVPNGAVPSVLLLWRGIFSLGLLKIVKSVTSVTSSLALIPIVASALSYLQCIKLYPVAYFALHWQACSSAQKPRQGPRKPNTPHSLREVYSDAPGVLSLRFRDIQGRYSMFIGRGLAAFNSASSSPNLQPLRRGLEPGAIRLSTTAVTHALPGHFKTV